MVKYFQQHKLVLILTLIVFLTILLVSACNLLDLGNKGTPTGPSTNILAPADGTKILAGSPVQIQSTHLGDNISRVELWVKRQDESVGILVRADKPIDGVILQQWVPQQAGIYTLAVKTYYDNSNQFSEVARSVEVISDPSVSLATVATPPLQSSGAIQPTVIPLTPLPISPADAAGAFLSQEVAIMQVVATVTPMPSPTPTPFYPPPPPVPGVPPGPLQSPQLNVHPPICDAAEYLGPYVGDTSQRIFIPGVEPEDDLLPVKVTAGTMVHRAWRIRNVGTCTWGPGYELAFYGGRAMGSGGATFEAIFPADPGRRNMVVDTNRLIVPEGKPNEIAVVEVLLTTPAIPGIHQSYWRMRNPQGVFFGPIVGVTIEVVRNCQPDPNDPNRTPIYGAPIINDFRVLGVANAFAPTPIPVAPVAPATTPIPPTYLAKVGQPVTLDWNVINVNNVDIVIEDPVGGVHRIAATDPHNNTPFTPTRLGDHIATLYADNGSCTVIQQLRIRVEPPDEKQFVITNLVFAANAPVDTSADATASVSSAIATNTVEVIWNYFTPEVTEFRLIARQQVKGADTSWQCAYLGVCSEVWRSGQTIKSEKFDRNTSGVMGREVLTDISTQLCRGAAPGMVRIEYKMEAIKSQDTPGPTLSNAVIVDCLSSASTTIAPGPTLPNEIPAP